MPTKAQLQAVLEDVVADLLPTTATEAERFAFCAALVQAARRFVPVHDCGPLCPEHGDDRDTSIDRAAAA